MAEKKAEKSTGRKEWFVIACHGDSRTGKTVRLPAPRGREEAKAMAKHLAVHGWGSHYEGPEDGPRVAAGTPSVVQLEVERNDPRFPALGKAAK